MSIYSHKSNSSQNSKRLAKKSEVDEGLFGNRKGVHNRDPEEVRKVTQEVRSGEIKNPNAIVIPKSELLRMKNAAVIKSKEEQIYQKKIHDEQSEKQQAAAKAKKQRMLDIEDERRKNLPAIQPEVEEKMKSNSLQTRAQKIMNEQKDEVKHMNQLQLYARTVTVRDKQLEEKKQIREQKILEEKGKDLMMEVERLQKIKHYNEVERKKKEEQKAKALEIIDQIKDREIQRLREQEEKEREGQEMLRAIKQLQKEEADAAIKKKQFQKSLNDQIAVDNQKAIGAKLVKIEEAKREEEKIVQYNIEKAQKEADFYAEQKRIKDEKEKEVARLRSLQEKANDRQAEMDELREKRAVELHERQAREKERREFEHKIQMDQDLFESRQQQALAKEVLLQEQAVKERNEFQKVIQQQKLERDLELKAELERKAMIRNHAEQVRKQMGQKEEKKKQEDRVRLEEGKKIRDQLAAEKRLLEKIKQEKLGELEDERIPGKYQRDLAKKKIII